MVIPCRCFSAASKTQQCLESPSYSFCFSCCFCNALLLRYLLMLLTKVPATIGGRSFRAFMATASTRTRENFKVSMGNFLDIPPQGFGVQMLKLNCRVPPLGFGVLIKMKFLPPYG